MDSAMRTDGRRVPYRQDATARSVQPSNAAHSLSERALNRVLKSDMDSLFCTERAKVKRHSSTISSWTDAAALFYDGGMSTKEEIGRRLELARKRSGLSLQAVCDKVPALNGNPSKLNNYEKGHRTPDLDMIKAIARVLNTDAAWLATLTDHEPDRRTSLLVQYYQGSDERGKDSILRTAELQSRYDQNVNPEDYPPESLCG